MRRSTLALLASSLLLTIGRGATLPFMTIYLNRQYGLGVDLIGYALTSDQRVNDWRHRADQRVNDWRHF
ncbi:Putative transport protein [Salmonella enterica subsp. enterica serovar Urbana str. R8-2977]|uniref:Putative transport protein n=1 Tax=Salmonella enterica subsp. enterica serovar Urbana str. R8-2977 TaxID=913084 RepID=G5RVH1_SALET|nr:Putative transport protein [Salmonella enterica subsp. enterica serovar Urbana str. R8-2977]